MTRTTQTSAQGRQILLDAARKQFLDRGYANVSIQQIAQEAGMTKGAPYYHFANKEDLFVNVSLGIFADLRELMADMLNTDAPLEERLTRAILEVVNTVAGDFSQWYSDMFRLADKQAITAGFKSAFGTTDMLDLFVPPFERAIERGEITRVSARVAANSFFLLLKAAIDDRHHRPQAKADGLGDWVKEIVDIYVHGVA